MRINNINNDIKIKVDELININKELQKENNELKLKNDEILKINNSL